MLRSESWCADSWRVGREQHIGHLNSMTELEYELRFTTPAFLGDEEQNGQWRTPPLKALLRQWWRVLQGASARQPDWKTIRETEGRLFGNAWLKKNDQPLHCKSPIRIRLEPDWAGGTLGASSWPTDFERVPTTRTGGNLPADLYLGYGPILREKGNLKIRTAIDPDKSVRLRLLLPPHRSDEILKTLTLIHWFGNVGSRARNGWGSVQLTPQGETPPPPSLRQADPLLAEVLRNWEQCHALDWPHAVGSDANGPLIWCTEDLANWRKAIGALANVRVAVRRAAKAIRNQHGRAAALHYLGYPAGTGKQNPWALAVRGERDKLRLASPLRFKVVPSSDGKVRGLIFHVPCAIPQAFLDELRNASDKEWLMDRANLRRAWQEIHKTLDHDSRLRRLGN